MVGYSLGGLIARYAVGLLDNKGFFDKMTPVNFTTFATPHLGTRTPLVGWLSHLYNDIGPRTLSVSGHQMWMIDDFRDTGRPLLSLLADKDGIFIKGLRRFKNLSLYSNIINDRSVPFYTSCIESKDPFVDLDSVDINYVPDTDNVILRHPMGDAGQQADYAVPKKTPLSFYESMSSSASRIVGKLPLYFFLTTLAPIGMGVFLSSSIFHSYKSAARIKEHESGQAATDYSKYRFPLPEKIRQQALEALSQAAHSQHQETLRDAPSTDKDVEANGGANGHAKEPHDAPQAAESDAKTPTDSSASTPANGSASTLAKPENLSKASLTKQEGSEFDDNFATLALTKEQFVMIENLNAVGFKKYPVHIKGANHSHAAIIVRMNRPGFGDGKVVAKHWVERWEI